MAALGSQAHLWIVFGRAFLLELERGNVERAQVFARAFLSRLAPFNGDRGVPRGGRGSPSVSR